MPPENDAPPDVEELDADDLVAADAPADAAGVLDRALADARAPRDDAARARRIGYYEREIDALSHGGDPDKGRIALYQHEVGELLEASGDEGAAVKAYAKALQSDATLKPNLWAIRRVFQRRALWPNLLKLLDAELRFAKSDAERAELLVEKGQLLEDKLRDVAQAKDCYLKAAEAHPSSVAAWMALEKLYVRDGDQAGEAQALRGLANATAEPARKVALLLDLARLLAATSLDQAVETCREAFAVGVEQERVLDELEVLAERGKRAADQLWALDARAKLAEDGLAALGVAERITQTERLVALLDRARETALALDAPDAPEFRDRAWGYLQRALEAAPGEPLLARELAELAERLGRWDDLAAALGRRLDSATPGARLGLQLERADALRRAGKPAEADACEADVVRDAPGHLGVLVAREREALRAGDWERLATLYLAEADLAAEGRTPSNAPDATWAATARVQAAAVYAEKLGKLAEAQTALERALEAVPGFRAATAALERVYARAGKHTEHAALLEKELEAQPDPARAERLLETLIAVRESGLDDPAGAAVAARRLVELKPDDVRVRARLVELDRAAARWAEAADDLAGLARIVADDRKLEALLERAEILERRLGDEPAAAAAYKEALALRPGEPRAAEAFEQLSRRRRAQPTDAPPAQAWDDLAQALRREAEASLSPERITAVLLKLGEIHERERQNFDDAAQAYRDLLDRAPGQPAALRGLARAYAQLGDHARRAETLEQEVETIQDTESRAGALVELGELYEDALKKDELADDAFARALKVDPSVAAHAAFGRLRTGVRRRDAAQLAEALDRLIGLTNEPGPARAALLEERALAERAVDAARAAELLQQSLADTASPSALLMRAQLAARGGDGRQLGVALEALAAAATDARAAAALDRRAGVLALAGGAAAHGGDAKAALDEAATRLKRAQSRVPTDGDVLVPLCDTVADAAALEHRALLAQGAAQVEWIVEWAEALEAAGRLAESARAAERALEADPRHLSALELLRRLARAGGDERGTARATARLAGEVMESERAAMLYAEAARTFEHVGLPDAAAGAWRAVLDRTPLDGTAFARARELIAARYAEDKEPGALVELYTHRLAHVQDAVDRVTLLSERATLLEREGDRAGAERDLRAMLDAQPDHPAATRRLGELLAADPNARAEALTLLARYVELDIDAQEKRAARVRMAELEEASAQYDAAVAHLEAAVELAPSQEAAVAEHERLAQLYTRQRKWQQAADTLARVAQLSPAGDARAAVEVRIADLYRDGFRDPKSAVGHLLHALEQAPLALEALSRLTQLADQGHVVQLQLDERLERAVAEATRRVGDDPASAAGYAALARVHGWRGDEDARVIAAQAQALAAGEPPPAREGAIEPSRELSAASWERMLSEDARGVALDVWRAAGEAAPKVLGPAVETFGVGKAERANAKGTPTSWIPIDKIARAFGCKDYELYVTKDRDACHATGAQLVCGMGFADRLGPRTRFRAAQKLALVRDRLPSLERLSEDELGVFFVACARVAEVAAPLALKRWANDPRAESMTKALSKAAGRKERKAIAALAPRLGDIIAPETWRRAVLDGATRAALVVGGDLPAAFEELALTANDPRARELMRFATSHDFLALRRELGLRS
jgi:tetratricopeptide (TPR) repeat protein